MTGNSGNYTSAGSNYPFCKGAVSFSAKSKRIIQTRVFVATKAIPAYIHHRCYVYAPESRAQMKNGRRFDFIVARE